MNTQNQQSNTLPPGVDPTVVALMHGLKMQENGGQINYNSIGDQGTASGAGQWSNQINGTPVKLQPGQIPANFQAQAKEYGYNPTDFSPANQNQVMYAQISADKKAGLSPEQILSKWNSGDPNKYLTANASGTGPVGPYNVSAYVKNAMNYAQQYVKNGSQQTTQTTPNPNSGFLGTNPNDSLYGKILNNSISRGIQDVFPGKEIGQDIGTYAGYAASGFNPNYNFSHPTALQTLGDAAQIALMVGGIPEVEGFSVLGKTIPTIKAAESGLGRVVQNVGLGGAYNAAGAVAGGSTNPTQILEQAGVGALTGGAAGVVGEGLNSLLKGLPSRLTTSVFKQLQDPDTINYAIKNVKLGTADSMLEHSQGALNSYNGQIDSILGHPDYNPTGGIQGIIPPEALNIRGTDVTQDVLNQFPNSEYSQLQIFNKLKTQLPSQAATITKLQNGSISLQDANELRKALDKISYKVAIDSPEIKAGKELAGAVGNSLRSQIQTKAPETAQVFSNFSKEVRLYKAIKKLIQNGGKKEIIGPKDILTLLGGAMYGGIPAAFGSEIAERVAGSPIAKLGAAKVINKLSPAIKTAVKVGSKASSLVPGAVEATGHSKQ